MASLTQRMAGVVNGLGQLCTVDMVFDSITFTVLTFLITNGWNASYTCTVTNTNLAQSFSRTVAAGATLSLTPPLTWALNADASLQNGWTFQG